MQHQRQVSTLRSDTWTTPGSWGKRPIALVFSDELTVDLEQLVEHRSKAALPFAGKYRVIDFALSNCVNSAIETIGVITQYQPRSLHSHLQHGRPWDLDRRQGGLTLLHPYQVGSGMGWYSGTADAVYQNLAFIHRYRTEHVFILFGSQVCTMDLGLAIEQMSKSEADLVVTAVPAAQAFERHTTLHVDQEGWVRQIVPPGEKDAGPLALMGVFLFSTEMLARQLTEDAQRSGSTHGLVQDVIPRMLASGARVIALQHTGYWCRLLTVYDYWRANMALLQEQPLLNLQDASWPIRTQVGIRPPARLSAGARVSHSLLSEGCVVDGTVEYSVLSPGVYVAPGAVVRNSIAMHDVTIEERALVEHAILDIDVIVGPQARVGRVQRHAPTLSPATREQLTILPKGARVPAGQVVLPDRSGSEWKFQVHPRDVASPRADTPPTC